MKNKKYYQYQYLMEKVFRMYHQILGTLDKSCRKNEIDSAMIRHDFYFKYNVGFKDNGKINGVDLIMASRCGYSADLSGAVNDRAVYNIDNAYLIPNIKIISHRCKTNTVSNTAFRGFGAPQGSFCMESIIDDILDVSEGSGDVEIEGVLNSDPSGGIDLRSS